MNDPLITLPLSEIVKLALGKGDCGGFTHTTPLVASIVEPVCKNEFMLHVQHTDRNGNMLIDLDTGQPSPRLWHIAAWRSDSERWCVQKRYYDFQREVSRVMEENIKIISRRLRLVYEFDEQQANVVAYGLMKKGKTGNIRALGVKNLIPSPGKVDQDHEQIMDGYYEPKKKKENVNDPQRTTEAP